MSASRLFWKAYFRHSLGVPWWVGPQKKTQFQSSLEAPSVSSQAMVFVTPRLDKEESLRKMLDRMIVAIGQDPSTLLCLSSDDPEFLKESLRPLQGHQKVIFFGSGMAAKGQSLGDWFSFGEAKAMVTHDLKDLKINPRLKKQTWDHLQIFAGIQ